MLSIIKFIMKKRPLIFGLLVFIVLMVVTSPLFYHSICANFPCGNVLFDKPCYCGLLMEEFLILLIINAVISFVVAFGITNLSNKRKNSGKGNKNN